MKTIKITFDSIDDLETFNLIWDVQVQWDQRNNYSKMIHSICEELQKKFIRKAFTDQKSYSMNLKVHEAMALWQYLMLILKHFPAGDYEFHLFRSVADTLDQQLA